MVTTRKRLDRLNTSLMAFVAIVIGWLLMTSLAGVVDPVGLVSILSAVLFVGAVVSLVAVIVLSGLFYFNVS